MRTEACLTLFAYSVIAMPSLVGAQDATRVLEEVVVTAQKRAVAAQDLPTTVSVVSGELMKRFDVVSFADLDTFVPGLIFTHTPGNNFSLTIRGIGTSSGQQAFEQSVSSYVDGIYGGFQKDYAIALFDLERVEVLKGTQSAILGKNTSVGAMNIVTRKPGVEFGGYVQGSYELEEGSTLFEGALDVPFSETFRVRFAGRAQQTEGFAENLVTGNDIPEIDHYTGRINAVWEVAPDVTATLMAQYDDQDILGETGNPVQDPGGALSAIDPRFTPGLDTNIVKFTGRGKGGDAFSELETTRASLTIDASLGEHTLTSVTAWSENEEAFALDLDYFVLDGSAFDQVAEYSQFTQELRLASPSDRRLTYLVGLYYWNSDWEKTFRSISDLNGNPNFIATLPYTLDTETFSIYGSLDIPITQKLTLGGTIRWVSEDKEVTIQNISNWPVVFTAFPFTTQERSPEFVDGSVTLKYDINEDVMVYGLVSRGTKTGSFADVTNNVIDDANEVDDEVATTYEVGTKMRLADGAANLNVSIWHMDIEDFQESIVIAGVFFTANQDETSDGVELQAAWQVSPELSMSGTVTYADAWNDTADVRALRAPEWTGSVDVIYEKPWAGTGWIWSIAGHGYYRSHYYNTPGNFGSHSDELTRLDLELALMHDEGWTFRLRGRNITDEVACGHGSFTNFQPTSRVCFLEPTRTVALEASYNF